MVYGFWGLGFSLGMGTFLFFRNSFGCRFYSHKSGAVCGKPSPEKNRIGFCPGSRSKGINLLQDLPQKVLCSGKGPGGHLTAGDALSPSRLEKSSHVMMMMIRAPPLLCADTAPSMQPSSRTGLVILPVIHSNGAGFHPRLIASVLLPWPIVLCSNYILLIERLLKADLESSLYRTINICVHSHVHKPWCLVPVELYRRALKLL